MADPHPIAEHNQRFKDLEGRVTATEEIVGRVDDWRTGGDLSHRGAEARIVVLEEYRAECEKLGILDKWTDMRRTVYQTKEVMVGKDEVSAIIAETVHKVVGEKGKSVVAVIAALAPYVAAAAAVAVALLK